MALIDDLYDRFVRAWHDGLVPDADVYLAQAPEADRDALADMIGTFVLIAPSVAPAPERAAELADDPGVLRALALVGDATPTTWGARLAAARGRAGLSLRELGDRFADAFALQGRGEDAASLLARLEAGSLPPSGVSARAASRLAELLGEAADALRPPPAPAPLFRADEDASDIAGALAAALAPAPAAGAEVDPLDELLGGGPLP